MQEILKYIGNWGKYQVFVYFICFIPFFHSGCLTLVSTFTAGVPNARCLVPDYDNSSTDYDTPFNNGGNDSKYLFPPPIIQSGANTYCSYCSLSNLASQTECTSETATKCSEFVYDTSVYRTSVVTQFNMVCDNYWMSELLESLFMVGVFLGAGIFGILGDKIGRRKSFIIAALSQIVVLNVTPFALNYYAYCILQILIGGLQVGTYLIGFTVVMELFGGLPKTIFGIWVQGMFALGYIYVGVVAYYIRDWQYLSWAVYLVSVFYIPLCCFFPESIRWLVVNEKQAEARKIVEKAARWNGVVIPEEVLEKELAPPPHLKQANILDLFKDSRMAVVTLIVFFTWMVDSLTYYGLSWNTSSLPGNPYVNFILSGLVELPSYVICIPLMEYLGRRWSLVGFLFIGGVSCIVSGFVEYVVLGLTNLGKLCISAAYAITYNYTAEVFPTVVRNAGTGFSSLMARIGSISAPQISLLSETAEWLPVVIFGSFGVVASILDLFLPETKNKQMPETLEEGIAFMRNKKRTDSTMPVIEESNYGSVEEKLKF